MKKQRMHINHSRATFLALLIVSLGAIQTFGQESRGTIIGRVADSTGAALAGVKVDIVSAATNVTSTVTTNDEGRFSAPFLLPGAYRVTAEKTGFKRFVQSGVEVRVSETTDLNIGMQAGELSEAVEITAVTPLLDTAGSSLGQVIDERRVQELPLFAGNPMELTLIANGLPSWADTFVGGWQIAFIVQRQSGPPIGFGNVIFTGDLKNLKLDGDQRDVDRWFNIDAGFNRNAAQQLASNVRSFPLRFSGLRADDQQRWDFSLSKSSTSTSASTPASAPRRSTCSTTAISAGRTPIRPTQTSGGLRARNPPLGVGSSR
jgi:hypothetical protein